MNNKLTFTILGCGSSPGVPRLNGDWGACDPNEPKNRRLRCSLLVERKSDDGITRIVVDTGPDFREQMITAKVPELDAVIYTHSHADHLHGIDDLRSFAMVQRSRIPIYADDATMERIVEGFGYCLKQLEGSMYPPILEGHKIIAGEPFSIDGKGGPIHILPVKQQHGYIHSLGFRFASDAKFTDGGLMYSSDISDVPTQSLNYFKNLDCWIVDALQYREHTSHFSLSEALEWVSKFSPKQAVLTHMHIPMDYRTLENELPKNVEPAYDGMRLEF